MSVSFLKRNFSIDFMVSIQIKTYTQICIFLVFSLDFHEIGRYYKTDYLGLYYNSYCFTFNLRQRNKDLLQ